jgi:hypothetical protein
MAAAVFSVAFYWAAEMALIATSMVELTTCA